jgi:hypothetical protein
VAVALRLLLNLVRGKSALELRGREVLMLRQFADRVSKEAPCPLSGRRAKWIPPLVIG